MKKILKFTLLFFLIISCAKEEDNSEVENLTKPKGDDKTTPLTN